MLEICKDNRLIAFPRESFAEASFFPSGGGGGAVGIPTALNHVTFEKQSQISPDLVKMEIIITPFKFWPRFLLDG